MHPALPDLRALHLIDQRILQLKRAQAALDTGADVERELKCLQADLDAATARLRSLRAELQDAELSLKAIETKKKNYERKLYSGEVGNPKELESIQHEIQVLAESKDHAEDRILTLMDAIEPVAAEAEGLEKEIAALEARLGEIRAEHAKRTAILQAQMAEAVAARAPAAEKVDPVVLRRYEDLRARGGGIGLAEVIEGSCSACRMAIPSNTLRNLADSTGLVFCESCNRILYPPKESPK